MPAVALFPETLELRVMEHPETQLESPDAVKIRPLEVGLCGTDRELSSSPFGAQPPAGSEYLVLGHECLAEVVETGDAISGLRPGDLVIPEVRRPCRHSHCEPCRQNRADHCITREYSESGIRRRHGFLTESAIEDPRHLHLVPAALRRFAVLAEPLTIAEKAFVRLAAIQRSLPSAGQNALVLGAGPVGLLGAMALRSQGFDVTVYSYSDGCAAKQDIVRSIGARFIDAAECEKPKVAIDVVYEAAGSADLTFAILPLLAPNAVFILTGAGGKPNPIQVDGNDLLLTMIRNNHVLMGTVNAAPENYEDAIRDLALFGERWPEALERLITNRFGIRDAIDAIRCRSGIKNIVDLQA